MKTYVEKVSWDNQQGDNSGYIYGINYIDFEGEGDILDCEWYKTEEEREKAISELENVIILSE